nr:actin [Parasteatoda tepidariorum]
MLFNDDSGDEQEHIQGQFPENKSSYVNDPQRFSYYTDELEVIPEEDSEYDSCDESSSKSDLHWDSEKKNYVEKLNEDSANKTFNDSIENSKCHKNNMLIFGNNVFPEESNDILQPRNSTSSWDPKTLLDALYRLDFSNKPQTQKACYLNKEGYIEMLPHGRKKATYWNPWKKKYIRLKNGFLFCYDNMQSEQPSLTIQLMGGQIEILDNKIIGIDDQKGHFIVLRCINEDDVDTWFDAFSSQCTEDFMNTYTSPCPHPISINKKVVVIDLGSSSIRAGILKSSPSLPQLFFPTVCAINKKSQKKIFGCGALNPDIRKDSYLKFLLHPSAKVAKYSIDTSLLLDLLKYIFQELNIYPEDYKVQLSMPRNLNFQTKLKIAHILLDDFQVEGLNLTHQAILSLHAYNSKSGIVVDIGDRLDVIPIIEGYIVESGVTRLPYGGQRMLHHLKHALTEMNISLVSDAETYLARYTLEHLCYVAEDYTEELQKYYSQKEDFCMSVPTAQFFQEQCPFQEMFLDIGRFHVPEGLFTPEIWGLDNFGLHKLVYHAIHECGVDLRKEMTKNIYISGGLTLLPGFVERLEREIDKITPKTITPKVHASPYRYHMSYIGACQIALEQKFENLCLTKKIWKKEGNSCVKMWHT